MRRLGVAAEAGYSAFVAAWRGGAHADRRAREAALRERQLRERHECERRVVASAASDVRRLIGRVSRLPDFTSGLGTRAPDHFASRVLAVARRLKRVGAPELLCAQARAALGACAALDARARGYTDAVVAGCQHHPADFVYREANSWPSSRLWPRYPATARERLLALAEALEARECELRRSLAELCARTASRVA